MNNKYLNCFIFSKSFYNYNVLFLHASKGRLVDILCMFIYIYMSTLHILGFSSRFLITLSVLNILMIYAFA